MMALFTTCLAPQTAADGIRTHNIYLGKAALYH